MGKMEEGVKHRYSIKNNDGKVQERLLMKLKRQNERYRNEPDFAVKKKLYAINRYYIHKYGMNKDEYDKANRKEV